MIINNTVNGTIPYNSSIYASWSYGGLDNNEINKRNKILDVLPCCSRLAVEPA